MALIIKFSTLNRFKISYPKKINFSVIVYITLHCWIRSQILPLPPPPMNDFKIWRRLLKVCDAQMDGNEDIRTKSDSKEVCEHQSMLFVNTFDLLGFAQNRRKKWGGACSMIKVNTWMCKFAVIPRRPNFCLKMSTCPQKSRTMATPLLLLNLTCLNARLGIQILKSNVRIREQEICSRDANSQYQQLPYTVCRLPRDIQT